MALDTRSSEKEILLCKNKDEMGKGGNFHSEAVITSFCVCGVIGSSEQFSVLPQPHQRFFTFSILPGHFQTCSGSLCS